MSGEDLDPERIAAARAVISVPKTWVSGDEMVWVNNAGKPPGFKLRGALETVERYQPAGLFVDIYYKASRIPGVRDKISFTLMLNGARILGLDDNGVSHHRNDFGVGRPLYGQEVGFPHLHTVSDDAIYGYAEPLEAAPPAELWSEFLRRATILYAPPLRLPTVQQDLFT